MLPWPGCCRAARFCSSSPACWRFCFWFIGFCVPVPPFGSKRPSYCGSKFWPEPWLYPISHEGRPSRLKATVTLRAAVVPDSSRIASRVHRIRFCSRPCVRGPSALAALAYDPALCRPAAARSRPWCGFSGSEASRPVRNCASTCLAFRPATRIPQQFPPRTPIVAPTQHTR